MWYAIVSALGAMAALIFDLLAWQRERDSIDSSRRRKRALRLKTSAAVGAILAVVMSMLAAIDGGRIEGQLATLSRETKDLVTGGNSFVWVRLIADPDHPELLTGHIRHSGDRVPTFDVNIEIMKEFGECNEMNPWTAGQALLWGNDRQHFYSAITENGVHVLPNDFHPSCDDAEYWILINARNGTFIQQIRLAKVNNSWEQATRVRTFPARKTLLEMHDSGFPASGQAMQWSDIPTARWESYLKATTPSTSPH